MFHYYTLRVIFPCWLFLQFISIIAELLPSFGNMVTSGTIKASPWGGGFQVSFKSVASGPGIEVCGIFSNRDLASTTERGAAKDNSNSL